MDLIVVIGPESTGTRVTTKIVKEATGYPVRFLPELWNGEFVEPKKGTITRRSLPHGPIGDGRIFWDTLKLHPNAINCGWNPVYLFTTRDRSIVGKSKMREHTRGNLELTIEEIEKAESMLRAHLMMGFPTEVIALESIIMLGPIVVINSLKNLGIKADPVNFEIRDANKKYFEEV